MQSPEDRTVLELIPVILQVREELRANPHMLLGKLMIRNERFLYFDLGKVLVDFDVTRMCRQMGEVAGLSTEQVYRVIYSNGLQRRLELGLLDLEGFYEEFCNRIGKRPDFAALLAAANDIFSLNVDVVPLVAQVAHAGYRIGLLSNTCINHWEFIGTRFRGIIELFPVWVLSFEVHAMKPNAAIFEAATKSAGLPPEKIFFVDDNAANVEGARACGWDAVTFQGPKALAEELEKRGIHINL